MMTPTVCLDELPTVCPVDGSALRLDTEHAALVAREDRPDVFPLLWRCTASGHTVMDREPEPYRAQSTRACLANRANGIKGGAEISRLKKLGRFYKPRPCYECGKVFAPTSGNQRCEACR